MLFRHRVRGDRSSRFSAMARPDGNCYEETSPVLAGRLKVDDPRDTLACIGSAPIDVSAIGPFAIAPEGLFSGARCASRVEAEPGVG
jgi:hypothetical protein